MRDISKSAWLLVLLSAALQTLIFPLPNLYFLCWFAVAPLLIALLRTRPPGVLQLTEGVKLVPARPAQGFLLGYVCGVAWYGSTCYWILPTMRQFGGLGAFPALGILFLFCLYLALYHGFFGLIVSLLAGADRISRKALLLAPVVWVGIELARTRITGFPWDLLGITQVDNVPFCRIATVTGVYGLSFEIMIVNAAMAAAFLVVREKRKALLLMSLGAACVLQAGRLIAPAALPTDHTAVLVQQNIPILEGGDWTREYLEGTLRDLTWISVSAAGGNPRPDLIVWPESPAPFYVSDPTFRDAVSNIARQTNVWMITGSLGTGAGGHSGGRSSQTYNSAALISPQGEWVAQYNKVHLVPFGEYVPFRRLFSFASGLTEQVGDFSMGTSRQPLQAGNTSLGVFICYESIFPDEVRRFAVEGAQAFVNISNDGWYGDSGAYAQHLKQARMRAVENGRWLLRSTNTGVTASIDPYGRVVVTAPRKLRMALRAPYSLSSATTFYTRHGDWFAYLCAIISVAALLTLIPLPGRKSQKP